MIQLKHIVDQCDELIQLKKKSLNRGDIIYIKTQNSTYKIKVDEKGFYFVSGGWFDKNKNNQNKVTINGCTWGGNIIKNDIVAAVGLLVEFGNKVITSKIRKFFIIPKFKMN